MKQHLLFLLLFSTTFLFAQSQNFSRIKISLEGKNIGQLAAMGLDVEHGDYEADQSFTGDFSTREMQQISAAGFTYETIIADVQEHYVAQNRDAFTQAEQRTVGDCSGVGFYDYFIPDNFELGSMGGFLTYEEMLANLDAMHALYPDLITERAAIGPILTYDGRPIYWVRLSDNASQDETGEPEIFYNALHHSREPNALTQLIYYMWYLLERYDTDPEAKYLLEQTEMYFVPMINPDGYVYNQITNPDGGGLHRKNKRDNNGNGTFEPDEDGVDLNRNYGYEWGFDDNGSSGNPTSAVYRGPSAFSEPETQNIRDFCNAREFEVALNYHTYGNLLIYPWAYSDELADPLFAHFAEALNRENEFFAGTSTETVGYQVNGPADDWMFGETTTKDAIYSFTPEVGYNIYGFWPPMDEIVRFSQSALLQNLTLAHLPLNYGLLTEENEAILEDIDGQFNFRLQRYGLKDGELIVSLQPASDNIVATSAPQAFTLTQGQEITSFFNYTLASDIEVGEAVTFVLSLDNGLYISSDTIVKSYGLPTNVFADEGDAMDNWTNVTPTSGWGTVTSLFYSAPSCIGDSPNGYYLAGSENIVQLASPVSLSTATDAKLSFWAIWEIEPLRDFAQVQISKNNGLTWEPACGLYTQAGTNLQDLGEPVYQGFQTEWVREEIDLSEFLGEEILIRFRMKANNNFFTAEGFHFDDMSISIFEESVPSKVFEVADFVFSQNHPNPARDYTVIDLEKPMSGSLHVYNVLGEKIHEQNFLEADREIIIRTESWTAGLYSYRLQIGAEWTGARKMVVGE
jgi:carboxypeptidase T